MISDATRSGDRTTRVLVLGSLTAAAVALLVPGLRTPLMLFAVWASPVLVLRGRHVHQRSSWPWLAVAGMLTAWASGFTVGEFLGPHHVAVPVCMGVGQALGVVVTTHLIRVTSRDRDRGGAGTSGGTLDVVVVVAVLVTVASQLAAAGGMDPYYVVVASVDIALLGAFVKLLVSRTGLSPASQLFMACGVLSLTYDLSTALHDSRLAQPGSPEVILGTLAVLASACAATHPSMDTAFDPSALAHRRPDSTALLGLLPLVLAPAVLAWVTASSAGSGLPSWVVPVAGAVVASLCLVRAARALRATERLAERDPLTDLTNRRGLARAHRQWQGPPGLLLLDLDDFKQVNDTHGHDVGDLLLLAVRDRLLAATAQDGVVTRLGGDEFVVLGAPMQLRSVADRILAALRPPLVVGALRLRAGASIGLATSGPGEDEVDLAALLTHADIAMYAAKAEGGGRVATFHPDMRAQVTARYALSDDVRQLLTAEDPDVGQLEVHFQPVVDLRTGVAVSAEALVRWRHPVHGLLTPDAFLGLVGSNDLDTRLDAAVLRATVDHLRRWQDEERPVLPVSVNLTGASLAEADLATTVLSMLADAGVSSSSLRLEITEQDEVAGAGPAAASLRELHAAGVLILLDDYGTGYTSLDYLRRFPVQVLKLDRSLVGVPPLAVGAAPAVAPVPDALDRSQIIAAVTAMAVHLGLQVIAEGVETAAQQIELLGLGVRHAQGYFFSRPVGAEEFAAAHLPRAPRNTPSTPTTGDAFPPEGAVAGRGPRL